MTAARAHSLPACVTANNLAEFAGGVAALQQKAASAAFEPWSPQWRNFMAAEVIAESIKNVGAWLADQLGAQVSLFIMMNGPRPSMPGRDPDEWDNAFQDDLLRFLEPHFRVVFPDNSTRARNILNWLCRDCPNPLDLMDEPEVRQQVATLLANETVKAIRALRNSPGQWLAMLGIVPAVCVPPDEAAREATTWAPAEEQLEVRAGAEKVLIGRILTKAEHKEAGKILDKMITRDRKRAKRLPRVGLHLAAKFLGELKSTGHYSSKELAAALGATTSQINNGLTHDGIIVSREDADTLLRSLNSRREILDDLANKVDQQIVLVASVR